jgi:hypothetical protein
MASGLLPCVVLCTATVATLPTVALRDGRVLHNVRIMAYEGDSIVVHADEGLIKVAKINLPPGVVDSMPKITPTPAVAGVVMQTFDPNQAIGDEPEAKPIPKAKPNTVIPEAPQPGEASVVYKGCSIVSFQKKAFQTALGCAEVVIRNDTESPAVVIPSDIVCVAANGSRHPGHFIVADGFPPRVKRREFVPSHGSVDDIVAFTDDDIDISQVKWAR